MRAHILLDVQEISGLGSVATLIVANEAKLNVLNTPILREFDEVLTGLHNDESLRVVVLRGAGDRAFIGGADINEMATLDSTTASEFIELIHCVCQAIRELPVPVIARIEGYCLGAGLEVAAACDLRVAAVGSSYGMPEVRVGLPSVIEAALLPGLIGWGKTREMLYTGDLYSAREALEMGFIERLVEEDELDRAVDDCVESIMKAGPRSIRLQKELIRQWEALPLHQAIEAGIGSFRRAFETDEPSEYMKRFLNRDRGRGG